MNIQKEKRAIQYLKSFEPKEEPYYLCYSGGKDSDVIKILAQLSNIKYESVHNLTTVDAPETVNYVKSQKDVKINYPHTSMWKLIEQKTLPPTRLMRYCCEVFKEHGGEGRLKITGVRWDESRNRKESADVVRIIGKPKGTQKLAEETNANFQVTKKGGLVLQDDNSESRRMVEQCYRTRTTTINPIVDWTDKDVWDFLHHYGCESNPLYQCGFSRIGCVGCPMAGKHRKTEFELYPKYKENYIKAFDRMLKRREEIGRDNRGWTCGEDVFSWWMEESELDRNQIHFLEEIEE